MSAPSFNRFDAYYLAPHSHVWNRRIHLAGWVLAPESMHIGQLS